MKQMNPVAMILLVAGLCLGLVIGSATAAELSYAYVAGPGTGMDDYVNGPTSYGDVIAGNATLTITCSDGGDDLWEVDVSRWHYGHHWKISRFDDKTSSDADGSWSYAAGEGWGYGLLAAGYDADVDASSFTNTHKGTDYYEYQVASSGLLNGLEIGTIDLRDESAKEFYVELPIAISATGSYHDLGAFISGMAGLPRIVTLHDFNIFVSPQGSSALQMSIVAKTYRYKDDEGV